ncbi:nitroreductase family protein [Gilliamella sp. B2772]|uniref:nitroreductase family protein n=1 Tax=Gilliamella sp. B2772 TaxID=2817981 RepID=UPI0022698F55|nr:nitroreductase family protein [Gilliamella sp. B2772]MCX8660613.1 nitroreductase family protein [Gilliamella sp. B2772]
MLLRRFAIVLLLSCFSYSYADVTLPAPQNKEGMGLFDSLKKRASTPGGGFPTGMVSDEELSSVLWAASGLNRGKNGWTVPMASGKAPYVRLYVASEKGTFIYEWEGHYLREINNQDIRGDIGKQSFTKRAPYIFIFVSDGDNLKDYDTQQANDFSQIAVGAMSQNVYLSATALKLSTRYIHSINPEFISQSLQLPENSKPIGIMLLGK